VTLNAHRGVLAKDLDIRNSAGCTAHVGHKMRPVANRQLMEADPAAPPLDPHRPFAELSAELSKVTAEAQNGGFLLVTFT
jgi:hypothetical protein